VEGLQVSARDVDRTEEVRQGSAQIEKMLFRLSDQP